MTMTTGTAVTAPTRRTDLAAAVRAWAALDPERVACTFLGYDGEDVTANTFTYADLDRHARAVAARVQSVGEPGDRVALLIRHGWEYVVAFLGCLYTDRIGVPLYAAHFGRGADRLAAVLGDARPAVSLCAPGDEGPAEQVRAQGAPVGELIVVDGSGDPEAWVDPRSGLDDPSYLQYTSGSTRTPAGVVVTARNLATATRQLREASNAGEAGPVVSWLPFFHDMGLVAVATPLQAGGHAVFLDPLAFVQRPVRWLRAVSDYRGQFSVVPNMGLDAAVHRVTEEERAGLDLSSLQVLGNGAEPIRAASMDAFTRTYEPYGFRHEAHRPGYGLAEATLMVSTGRHGEGPTVLRVDREQLAAGRAVTLAEDADPATAVTIVGCGRPIDQEVRVVDPQSRLSLPDDTVGEIWVRGDNVCDGYFARPEQTSEVFGAVLADPGADPDGPWLRTGDLGFVHDEVVFIAARLKDLVIVGGKNHYPADIEATVAESEDLVRRVAAFAVDAERGEQVVVVAEVDLRRADAFDPALTIRRVRAVLSRRHELEAADVVLVGTGSIPRTTSGKIQRRACRQAYLDGALTPLG